MVRSNKRSKKMKWGGDPSDSGATTNDYSTVSPVGGPPNPNSNPPVGGPPPASDTDEKSIFGKIGAAFSSILPGSGDDIAKLEKDVQETAKDEEAAKAKAKEAADALAAAKAKQIGKQIGGRRRRTRRGKRSGCKRCGLKRCGCSKKRRTRR
jgi:hypothetical protein